MYNEEKLSVDDSVGDVVLPRPTTIGRRNHALSGAHRAMRNDTTTEGDPSVFTRGLIIGF